MPWGRDQIIHIFIRGKCDKDYWTLELKKWSKRHKCLYQNGNEILLMIPKWIINKIHWKIHNFVKQKYSNENTLSYTQNLWPSLHSRSKSLVPGILSAFKDTLRFTASFYWIAVSLSPVTTQMMIPDAIIPELSSNSFH